MFKDFLSISQNLAFFLSLSLYFLKVFFKNNIWFTLFQIYIYMYIFSIFFSKEKQEIWVNRNYFCSKKILLLFSLFDLCLLKVFIAIDYRIENSRTIYIWWYGILHKVEKKLSKIVYKLYGYFSIYFEILFYRICEQKKSTRLNLL